MFRCSAFRESIISHAKRIYLYAHVHVQMFCIYIYTCSDVSAYRCYTYRESIISHAKHCGRRITWGRTWCAAGTRAVARNDTLTDGDLTADSRDAFAHVDPGQHNEVVLREDVAMYMLAAMIRCRPRWKAVRARRSSPRPATDWRSAGIHGSRWIVSRD